MYKGIPFFLEKLVIRLKNLVYRDQHDFGDGNGPVPAYCHRNGWGWVANTARVSRKAYVSPCARVFGHAWVKGNVRIYNEAIVCDRAIVRDYAQVGGNAQVKGDAVISDFAKVYDSAVVDSASVGQDATVFGSAILCADTRVRKLARISGSVQLISCWVGGDAFILGAGELHHESFSVGRHVIGGGFYRFDNSATPDCSEVAQLNGHQDDRVAVNHPALEDVKVTDSWI